MPIEPGEISIGIPTAGQSFSVGTTIRVAGGATAGIFTKPNGTFTAVLPPTVVTVKIDGGSALTATMLAPDWSGWEANIQLTSPGQRVITATARRTGTSGNAVWKATTTVSINAVTPLLRISGVEQTQAIQFFLINGQGSGNGPNNSVPLVAKKPTVLRVYVDRLTAPGQPGPTTVTASLTQTGLAISPANGPIPAISAASIDRRNANNTINFWLNPVLCQGSKSFTVTASDPAHPGDQAYISTPVNIGLNFDEVPRVRIYGVLIHYTGLGANITAPTGQDLMTSLVWVNEVYPTSSFDFTGFTVLEFNGSLQTAGGGGCGTGWNQLMGKLQDLRSASKSSDQYVGILPTGVPTLGVIGCGGGGTAVAYRGDSSTFAQEIGHGFGVAHAPCGNPGGPDPNYPTYDSYPSGSIGEHGLDTSNFQVHDPASTFDFMSYCAPTWVSPYVYIKLKNAIVTAPASASAGRAEVAEVSAEFLYLNFRLHRNNRIEVLPSFHLVGPPPEADIRELSDVSLDLVTQEGDVLVRHQCHLRDPHQSPQKEYMDFHEPIPWDSRTNSIVFYRNDEKLLEQEVVDSPPNIRVSILRPEDEQARRETVRLNWENDSDSPGDLTYLVRYSNDGGQTWRALASDLREQHYDVDLSLLPGGKRCRLQIVVSSGIRTKTEESEEFDVPLKPVAAYILAPQDDAQIAEGEALSLLGLGYSPDSGTTEFDDAVWISDRDGELGIGQRLVVQGLTPGLHRIQLTVGGRSDQSTSTTVSVVVRGKDAGGTKDASSGP